MSAPVVFRPRASLRMASSLSVTLIASAVLGWLLTPPMIRAQFTAFQLLTLVFFLVVMVGMMMGLGLSFVRADERGLRFRNGLRTHDLAWDEVSAIRFRPGDPWAYALLRTEPEQLALMGIQRTDRELAQRDVAELRRRLAEAYGLDQEG